MERELRRQGLERSHRNIVKLRRFEEARREMHETRMHKIAEESAKKQQVREAKLKDLEDIERSRRQYMAMKDKQRAKTIQAFRSAM